MNKRLNSLLSAPDTRPILVSVLAALWLVMSAFGGLQATMVLAGLGTEPVDPSDPMARLAIEEPDLVDPQWIQAREQQTQRRDLERTLAIPMLLVATLGITGAIRLFLRRPWARTMLVLAGLGAITVSALYHMKSTAISLQGAADVTLPEGTESTFHSVALMNILFQSLPVLIGMSLLRHRIVGEYVRGRGRGEREAGK